MSRFGTRRAARLATLVDIVDDAATASGDIRLYLDRPLDVTHDERTVLTYSDLAQIGRQISAGLHAAGVRRGDRVAVVKSNHVDIFLIAYAAMRIGAIPALISPELEPSVTSELLDTLGHPTLLTDAAVIEHKALRGLDVGALSPCPLVVGEVVPPGTSALALDAPTPDPAVVVGPDEPVLITHTSGTTGVPKLAIQSHRTLDANWSTVAVWAKVLSVRERAGVYLSFPHIRVVTGVASLLLMRWSLVIVTDPDPAHVDAVFAEYKPGVIETFPNTYILWERLLSSSSRPFANARFFLNTFDAMHPRTLQALLSGSSRRGATYLQLYGQTETGPITARFYPRRLAAHAHGRCVGYPLVGFSRFRIAPRPHEHHAGGGDIVVRSKALVLGYVGGERQYAENFRDGWWRMTDIGERTRWGCLHLRDREIDETDHTSSVLALEDRLLNRLGDLTEVVLLPTGDGKLAPVVCTRNDASLDLGAWTAATTDVRATLLPPSHCRWEDVPHTATWKVRRVEARRQLERNELPTIAA